MHNRPLLRRLAGLALLALAAPAALAQAQIDQGKVNAGNVTPGDAPGFPLTISVPGSYKLTSNLVVPSGTPGIQITAAGVTLDLNGFGVRSTNTCVHDPFFKRFHCAESPLAGASGIVMSGAAKRGPISIRSGFVEGFRGDGIQGGTARLRDLSVQHNVGFGIHMAGVNGAIGGAQIVDVEVALNGDTGLQATNALISRIVARENGADGVIMLGVSALHESLASWNLRCGVRGQRELGGGVRGVVSGPVYGVRCPIIDANTMGGNLRHVTPF